jgi:hypothetical protein
MSESFGNDGMRHFGALTDDEVELVLSGGEPADQALVPLVDFVGLLRAEATRTPDEAVAAHRVAAVVEAVVHSLDATQHDEAPILSRTRASSVFVSLKSRAIGVIAVVGLLTGATGVAWATNNASPGHALYGLDTALETFGILNGGAEERLVEVRDLLQSGDLAGGLSFAADAVNQNGLDDSSASDALEDAAARLSSSGDAPSEQVRQSVGALLDYLADNLDDLDSEIVADMAQAIGGAPADPGPRPTPPRPTP